MAEINKPDSNVHGVLSGGGEMGKLIRSMDWSNNPLGPINSWPQSLLTTVSLCLASNFPICMIWGKEHIQIYNDGYIPICGALHPKSLGMDFTKCWAPAMPVIGEGFYGALAGNASFVENQKVFVNRYGFLEEIFVTVSFSPIRDESGDVGGVFHPLTEQTSTILSKRRTRAMRDLAARTGNAKTIEEVFLMAVQNLADYNLDLPFALFYTLDQDGRHLQLIANSGIEPGTCASPTMVDLQASMMWPMLEVLNSGRNKQVDHIEGIFGQLHCGPYPESPNTAIIIPITAPGSACPFGILVAGVSPRLALNDAYLDFYDLLKSNINAAVAHAHAYEQERNRAEALAEIDKAKTVFFSNVSHEFRTPLTLMLGPLEEVLKNDTSMKATSKEQIQTVHRNSLRLLKLVNTLLDFSRIEAGRIEAVYSETDICNLTLDLSSTFRSAIEKAGIEFNVHCAHFSHPVYVDRTMWERIIFNLLSNAFKFTFNGKISISLIQIDKNLELKVNDTGNGIPKEELPKLFSRFHRVENALGRTHEGSGIGLAMVQELVKLHGGTINVESKVGEGSSFIVVIPTGKEHLDPNRIALSTSKISKTLNALPSIEEEIGVFSEASYGGNSLENSTDEESSDKVKDKILIADDNEDMREYLTRLLKSRYEVIAVKDGLEALEAAERESPCLILSDVMMPRLDGFGLLKELRARNKLKSIPVIFLSARAGEEATIEGMEAGADDYLVKPFSSKELLSRVNSNIKISRHRCESEKNLRNLFKQAPIAICILKEPSFVIELANERVLELWGKSYDEVINKPTLEVFPELISQGFDKILDNVYNKGESFVANELGIDLVRHGKLETVYLNFVYDPLLDSEGKTCGIVAVGVDVTDMVKARKLVEENAEELKSKNEELIKINADLDNFIYTASHDLKAPMSNIEGLLSTMRESLQMEHEKLSEDTEFIIQLMEGSITRFKNTIQDLTEITKVQKIEEEDVKEINFKEVLEDVKFSIYNKITESKAAIETDFSKAATIKFSKKNLNSILYNLLGNAIKYQDKNRAPQIFIKTDIDSGYIVLTINDNGLGIGKENQSKMFTMFKRFHDHVEGTGIGLYIVKRIIDNAGGKIEVESELGTGTTFKVFFKI